MPTRLSIGTGGFAVWHSDDLGETWARPYAEDGIYPEARVRALVNDIREPSTMWAGTDLGVFRRREQDGRWQAMNMPPAGQCIWSLAQSPHNAEVFLAGTQYPAALFISEDDCRSWRQLQTNFAERCMFVGWPRVTQLLFDPNDTNTIYAGVEIDGIYRSDDRGRHWKKVTAGMVSEDLHCLIATGPRRDVLIATTNRGLHRSGDRGEQWEHVPIDTPSPYMRTVMEKPDGSGELLLCNGNGPPGSTGWLLRSADLGNTWSRVALPGPLNSTPWCFAMSAQTPSLMFLCSNLGQVFRSDNSGCNWAQLKREFGEIRCASLVSF